MLNSCSSFLRMVGWFISLCLFTLPVQSQTDDLTKTGPHSTPITFKSDTLTLVGVGDIMMGTNFPNTSYLPPNDGRDLLKPILPFLQSADITFGNLEGTLLDRGGQVKRCSNPKLCYAFRSPERYAAYLKEAGFDIVSLANNHSGDFGLTGRNKTIQTLDSYGIKYAGLLTNPVCIYEKNNVRYGLAAFAPNSGTCDIRNIEQAKAIVASLADSCDIVIVSFHGGAEGGRFRHVTRKTETFYGENRGNVYAFSHAVIDAGADVVFGHGPHITRGMELYKDRLICYSLGNFCTYARFNLRGENGLAPAVRVQIKKDGSFIQGHILATKQEGEGGPQIDNEKRVIKVIKELTKSDFPKTPLLIGDSGELKKQ